MMDQLFGLLGASVALAIASESESGAHYFPQFPVKYYKAIYHVRLPKPMRLEAGKKGAEDPRIKARDPRKFMCW
jgi:hypothetical protein